MTGTIGHNSAGGQVTVHLPGALRRLFADAPAEVTLSATSVDTLLDQLDERWPGMRDRLADTSPAIRRHINIFVDGRRATLETPLPDSADVYVLTAVSGG